MSQNEKEEKVLSCILFSRTGIFKNISIFKHQKKEFLYILDTSPLSDI